MMLGSKFLFKNIDKKLWAMMNYGAYKVDIVFSQNRPPLYSHGADCPSTPNVQFNTFCCSRNCRNLRLNLHICHHLQMNTCTGVHARHTSHCDQWSTLYSCKWGSTTTYRLEANSWRLQQEQPDDPEIAVVYCTIVNKLCFKNVKSVQWQIAWSSARKK